MVALPFSRMSRFGVALLCAVSSGLLAGAARAEPAAGRPTPAYVLSIWTDDADDQADALTQALRARLRQAPGWSLLDTSQSFETLAIALKCPPKPDPACLLRIGDQLKADHYFWGTLQKKPGSSEVTAEVHLWARGKPDAVTRRSFADGAGAPDAEAVGAAAADSLAALIAAPAAAPRTEPPVKVASPPADDPNDAPSGDGQGPSARKLIGYSAIVAGAGFFVASGIEAANWIADNNASNDDRKSVPRSVTDVCASPVNAAAQDACAKSHDAANVSTFGWIFAGVGAALVGTGVILLATGGSAPAAPEASRAAPPPRAASKATWELSPALGPGAGALRLRVTF